MSLVLILNLPISHQFCQGFLVLYQRALLKLSRGMRSPKLLWRYSLEGLFNQRHVRGCHRFANYPKLPLLVDAAWWLLQDVCVLLCVLGEASAWMRVCVCVYVLTVVMNYQLKCQPGVRKNIVQGFNQRMTSSATPLSMNTGTVWLYVLRISENKIMISCQVKYCKSL